MITKTTASPFKKSAGDIVPLDTGAKLGIGLTSPIGTLDVDTGSGGFCVTEVTLADEASVAVETILAGSIGLIWVSDISASPDAGGCVFIQGADNAATELMDAGGKISTGSTTPDGYFGIYSDLDGTYSLKNRLGSERTFSLMYLGED